jgi:transcription antitermination factor NusG
MFDRTDTCASSSPSQAGYPGYAGDGPAAELWFAAYTTPRHEKSVHRQLEARGWKSFLPLYRSTNRWKNGCKVEVQQPLFPNYIFVLSGRRQLVKVRQVPGVITIVGSGWEPTPISCSEIESLRSGLPGRKFEPHPYLAAGERVRIAAGPLSDMTGVLIRKKNNFRVVLSLDLILRSIAVEVGIDEVEPLKN